MTRGWSARRCRVVILLLGLGCLSPTEIRVELSTNADCGRLRSTLLEVPSAPSATTQSCTNGRIGDIVFVPSTSASRLDLRVTASIDGDCAPNSNPAHCIMARRSLGYINHTPLTLPIRLTVDCAGVLCDESTTCVDGLCVPSTVGQCTGGACAVVSDCGDRSALQAGAALPLAAFCPTRVNRSPRLGPRNATPVLDTIANGVFNGTCSDPVTAADGASYAICGDGGLYTFHGGTWVGSVGNAASGGAGPFPQPAIAKDGTLFTGNASGEIRTPASSTNVLYAISPPTIITSPIAIAPTSLVVFGGADGVLRGVDVSGALRFSTVIAPNQSVSAVAFGPDGSMFVSAGDLVARLTPNGELDWTFASKSPTAPLVTPNGEIVFGTTDSLVAIDAATHALKWTASVGDRTGVPARAVDGTLYVACRDAFLYAFHPDGSPAWRASFGGINNFDMPGAPTIAADGTVYVAGGDSLAAVRADGSLLWSLPFIHTVIGRSVSTPVLSGDGSLYVTNGSGIARVGP